MFERHKEWGLRRVIGYYSGEAQEGYIWEYVDIPSGEDNEFCSLNGSDPELNFYWKEHKN